MQPIESSQQKHPRSRRRSNNSRSKAAKQALSVSAKGKTKHLKAALQEGVYVVFDIETTGGNPEKNGITEIFALRFDRGEIVDTFYSLVNPKIPIPPIVRRMTGINDRMVKHAPLIDAVMPDFVDFVGDDVLVSHNTIGDMKFLRHFSKVTTGQMIENYYLCTHLLVEKLASEAPDKSLKGLADHFCLSADKQLHRAEADAYLTLELFKVLLEKLIDRGAEDIVGAIRLQGDYESGSRLGWGVEKDVLDNLPESPGVFYLTNVSGEILFFSSAHNIARDVRKLQKLSRLPRQLLKSVIASTELSYSESPTPFSAAIAEADALDRQPLRFDPGNWHQRTANFLYLKKDKQGVLLSTGPLSKDALFALGPVRGGKEVGILIEQIAQSFGKKIGKKGLALTELEAKHTIDLLNGWPVAKPNGLFSAVKSFVTKLKKADESLPQSVLDDLSSLAVPMDLHKIEACSGLLAVMRSDVWHVYLVACGIPIKELELHGDLIQALRHKNLHIKLFKKAKLTIQKKRKRGGLISADDVHMINRTFWWAYFGTRHEDIRILSMDELSRL
jgi:DNA polymerase III epsilon subunit family exonuclease